MQILSPEHGNFMPWNNAKNDMWDHLKDPGNACLPVTEVSQHHFDPAIDKISLPGGCLMKVTPLITVKGSVNVCVPITELSQHHFDPVQYTKLPSRVDV